MLKTILKLSFVAVQSQFESIFNPSKTILQDIATWYKSGRFKCWDSIDITGKQSVPYHGNLWSRYSGLGAQKIEQYSTQKFFYQTDKSSFLLREIHRKLDILNAYLRGKYSIYEKNMEISWKNMQQLPKPRCA